MQFPYLLNMLCELSLLFTKKEGVEEQFPEVTENSLYEKLWIPLIRVKLHDFGSTKPILRPLFVAPGASAPGAPHSVRPWVFGCPDSDPISVLCFTYFLLI